ncbi:MAG: zinc-binding dehydrogenase, partial [Actinomycetota bacterium]
GSEWKGERCLDLGADVAIDYHDDVPAAVADATNGQGVDVILDVLGAGALAANLQMLAPHGQLAIIGLQQGRRAELDLGQLMARRATVHGSTLRARTREEKAAIVAAATPYAPYIEPSVHAVLPLKRAGEAHVLMDEPGKFGKVVLQVR